MKTRPCALEFRMPLTASSDSGRHAKLRPGAKKITAATSVRLLQ